MCTLQRNIVKDTCRQSYKGSTIATYDSRVVPDLKIPHITRKLQALIVYKIGHWSPDWLDWILLNKYLYLVKQPNQPNQLNRRPAVQWYPYKVSECFVDQLRKRLYIMAKQLQYGKVIFEKTNNCNFK